MASFFGYGTTTGSIGGTPFRRKWAPMPSFSQPWPIDPANSSHQSQYTATQTCHHANRPNSTHAPGRPSSTLTLTPTLSRLTRFQFTRGSLALDRLLTPALCYSVVHFSFVVLGNLDTTLDADDGCLTPHVSGPGGGEILLIITPPFTRRLGPP